MLLHHQQDAEGTHNALGLPSQQVVKRQPRLMDSVRIRKPGTLWTVVDGVVLGSADGGERLKVRRIVLVRDWQTCRQHCIYIHEHVRPTTGIPSSASPHPSGRVPIEHSSLLDQAPSDNGTALVVR